MLFTGIQCKHGPYSYHRNRSLIQLFCDWLQMHDWKNKCVRWKRSTVGNKLRCFFPSSILVPTCISDVSSGLFDSSLPSNVINLLAIVPWGLRGNNISILQSFCFCHQLCTDRDVQPVSNATEDMRSHLAHQISETSQSWSSFSAFFVLCEGTRLLLGQASHVCVIQAGLKPSLRFNPRTQQHNPDTTLRSVCHIVAAAGRHWIWFQPI